MSSNQDHEQENEGDQHSEEPHFRVFEFTNWTLGGLDEVLEEITNEINHSPFSPLAKEDFNALPKINVTPQIVATKIYCSVCLENFIELEEVLQLPCTHIFHELCIKQWLETSSTCPICRLNLGNNPPNSNGNATNDISVLERLITTLFHPPSSRNSNENQGENSSTGSSDTPRSR